MLATVSAGVPVLVLAALAVAGMGLTAATAAQRLLLPLIGWLLVCCLSLSPTIARGMLLLSACPSGARANVCTSLAPALVAVIVFRRSRVAAGPILTGVHGP